jgi:hypothetical protein
MKWSSFVFLLFTEMMKVSLEANVEVFFVGLSVHGCDHVMLVQGENQVILTNQRCKLVSKIGGIFCGGTNLIPINFAIFFLAKHKN